MCLDDGAHGLVLDHDVFKTPLPVTRDFEARPTPENYREFAHGRDLGPTIPCWKVQTTGYTRRDCDFGPGVVSTGLGFEDSPDCEVIAGGLNTKGPESVAIGRQGPFVFWGFAAPPAKLTESGRRALVNAIVYAARFDRAPVLVRSVSQSRDQALQAAAYVAQVPAGHVTMMKYAADERAKRVALEAAATTRELTADEKARLGRKPYDPGTLEEYVKKTIESMTSPALFAEFGTDAAKYEDHYRRTFPYLVAKDGAFSADTEAEGLGLAIDSVASLDRAIVLLETDKEADRARRFLQRYTGLSHDGVAAWRAWLQLNREFLFFSDVGGQRFFSAKTSADDVRRRAMRRERPAVSNDSPVAARAFSFVTRARPGDVVPIVSRLTVADGWHVWAQLPPGRPYQPLRTDLQLPAGIRALGGWDMPPVEPRADGDGAYSGDVVMVQWVKIDEGVSGRREIVVTTAYQSCDVRRCLPPAEARASIVLDIAPRVIPELVGR